jgi:hypothetical protein
MANTYKGNPARGLSKLQKAILVWLLEAQEKHGGAWRAIEQRPSFYGGTHPLGRVFGNRMRYTAKERAAFSRSLKRLMHRGLVLTDSWGAERVHILALTSGGWEVARALKEQGATPEYRDLFPDGEEELRQICRDLAAQRGIDKLPESVEMVMARDPVKALKGILKGLHSGGGHVNRSDGGA